ncbi:coiled-coil domain-containing protein [Gimesia maris]|uniref:Chromosome partition protein Smc n=1 Tax=Gimesia maris TaxID=122 RepID=A0ABX5YR88_9PLAN|nr:hypothetical protein [Gimesia maris]EDL59218.1 hypothetical protein PM8797T_23264 [Gimesia maris DSM 8797]QEG18239.1 Chromosome partition protein Smc [Gimesia maris]QGQ28763.1 hypothetical protein F1729_08970 [Gimesia maris]
MQMLDMMSEEKDSIGWISMADVLLITTILLVGGAYGVAHYAGGQDRIIDELQRRVSLIDSAEEKIADLIRQINILKNENLILIRDKDTLDSQIKDLDKELASKKNTLETLQSLLAETKQVLQTKESMVRHLVSRIESLYQKLTTAQNELIVLIVKIDAIKEQLEKSEKELTASRLEITLLKKKVASLKEADDRIIKLKQKLDAVQKELVITRKQNTMLESELQEKHKELDKMSSKNALLNEEILNLQLSNKSLIAQCAAILEAEQVSEELWQKKFAELLKLLEDTNKAYSESQDTVKEYEDEIATYQEWFQQQNDRIMKPVETARVVIRVRAEDLPKSVDLDIYVQDPEDALCFWKQPRVLTEFAERATLIPSEALRFESVKKNRPPSSNIEEETYYASIPLTGKPYLVFCMFREKSKKTKYHPILQKITWDISIKNADSEAKILKGERILNCSTGGVEVDKTGDTTTELYPGLEPLTGFTVSDADKPEVTLLDEDELPGFLRGWKELTGEGTRYQKQSDQNSKSQ